MSSPACSTGPNYQMEAKDNYSQIVIKNNDKKWVKTWNRFLVEGREKSTVQYSLRETHC
jgi:hypothetical protein